MSARAGGSLLASSPLDSKSAGERWGLAPGGVGGASKGQPSAFIKSVSIADPPV